VVLVKQLLTNITNFVLLAVCSNLYAVTGLNSDL